MRSHPVSWIVVLGMAAVMTGCASGKSRSGTMMVHNSDYHRLKIQPTMIASMDDVTRVAPSEYSPTGAVKSTIADLLSILGNETLKQPARFEERRQQIEQVIRRRVNYERMAQRSLGASWTRLNDTQRQEFVRLFVELIRDKVANKIDQYYDEQVIFLSEQREGNYAEVRTNWIGPKVNTAVDFRLEDRSGDWLVYDVIIDDASIVRNYRTQFAQIIRDDSYEGLVERMGQRVLTVKLFERTASAIALSPRQ